MEEAGPACGQRRDARSRLSCLRLRRQLPGALLWMTATPCRPSAADSWLVNLLRCSVIDADAPHRSVDVDVHASPGRAFEDAVPQLLATVDAPLGRRLTVGGRALDGAMLLGEPPLVHGAL